MVPTCSSIFITYPSKYHVLLHASTLLPHSFANTCRLPLLEQGQIWWVATLQTRGGNWQQLGLSLCWGNLRSMGGSLPSKEVRSVSSGRTRSQTPFSHSWENLVSAHWGWLCVIRCWILLNPPTSFNALSFKPSPEVGDASLTRASAAAEVGDASLTRASGASLLPIKNWTSQWPQRAGIFNRTCCPSSPLSSPLS